MEAMECRECGGRLSMHRFDCRTGIRDTAARLLVSEPFMRTILGKQYSAEAAVRANVDRLATILPHASARQVAVLEAMVSLKAEGMGSEITEAIRSEEMRCRKCLEDEDKNAVAGEYAPANTDLTDRHKAAHEFAEFLDSSHLVAGQRESVVDKDPTGRSYIVRWAFGQKTGGDIQIFGRTWIKVSWYGDLEYMPMRGNRVFDDMFLAQEFLMLAFVDANWEAANSLPQRPMSAKAAARMAGGQK